MADPKITAYTKWEDMAAYFSQTLETLPKTTRFTTGEILLRSCFSLGSRLLQAEKCHDRQKRKAMLDEADCCNVGLTVGIRLLYRRKLINETKHTIVSQYLVEIGKMIGALIKSA